MYGEYTWYSGNNHSVELLTSIQRLLTTATVSFEQVDALAVATGPGSFNGVRVALTTAKTLAFALNKPLVGISTLDVIAVQQLHTQRVVGAVLEAGRSELYAAFYLLQAPSNLVSGQMYTLRHVGEYLLASPQDIAIYVRERLVQELAGPAGVVGGEQSEAVSLLLCGEISADTRQKLLASLPESLILKNVLATRHASLLAMLAFQRLRQGQLDDPRVLEPLYLRRPSITRSTRKQPLLGGSSGQTTDLLTTERGEGALRH